MPTDGFGLNSDLFTHVLLPLVQVNCTLDNIRWVFYFSHQIVVSRHQGFIHFNVACINHLDRI